MRAAAIAVQPHRARHWPAPLYHYDYIEREPQPKPVQFAVHASLPAILAAERKRMLDGCAVPRCLCRPAAGVP